MNEGIKDDKIFVGYEYKKVITYENNISFLIDGYKNFGWVVDENISQSVEANKPNTHANFVLRLKRNRKIMNKMELTRLQRNFEFCFKEIEHLEKSKTSEATIYAITVGIIGTAFMAGAVFSVMSTPPIFTLAIILSIPALAGWILPYFIYKNVVKKRTEKVNILIEKKHDEIFEICEKGSKLLH